MNHVTCSGCGSHWTIPPTAPGQVVPCPNCQRPLPLAAVAQPVAPRATPAPPPPPPARHPPAAYPAAVAQSAAVPPPPPPPARPLAVSQPAVPGLDVGSFARQYRAAAQRTFQESHSFLDIFDWRFEKYLTPWIVRLNWIMALVLASMWIVFITGSTIWSMMPDNNPSASTARPRSSMPFSVQPPQSNTGRLPAWLVVNAIKVGTAATMIAGAIYMLLTLRLSLEFAIVIFNIAKTVESIDEKSSATEPAR